MIVECEIKKAGGWELVGFDEALPIQGKVTMRCPRCFGAVTPYNGGGAKPHFMHHEAHEGCKASTPIRHPGALL